MPSERRDSDKQVDGDPSGGANSEDPRDAVIAAMAKHGRELSTATVLFHTLLSSRVGLGPTDEKVLELVHRRGAATAGELAELAGMRKNSMTDVIDRLEAKGFVQRQPHASDGRKVGVIGTAEGTRRIGALLEPLMTQLTHLYDDYSTAELETIAGYLERAAQIQSAATNDLV